MLFSSGVLEVFELWIIHPNSFPLELNNLFWINILVLNVYVYAYSYISTHVVFTIFLAEEAKELKQMCASRRHQLLDEIVEFRVQVIV